MFFVNSVGVSSFKASVVVADFLSKHGNPTDPMLAHLQEKFPPIMLTNATMPYIGTMMEKLATCETFSGRTTDDIRKAARKHHYALRLLFFHQKISNYSIKMTLLLID